ncbi:DUF397 domain-containing protein [Streptomyces radicis]|uniref:DUF397 domain-containing protein n=1 Tax=Streptomyces radicis TaxID=1750517 RepID=A0A3A9W0Y4_9ACTN|nr:DUF397 domain-containing protein [Streptomyces radicis]RKN06885.1 DUF397 domain-containing protein [Streptomyces radicis]RKN19503.1 DUF397 domain-containing protein [Streptomyces radicis]
MNGQLAWFKSSYSTDSGGNCLEVAVSWRKSGLGGAACAGTVGVRTVHAVHVRDSKDTARPGLAVSPAAWAAFAGGPLTRS